MTIQPSAAEALRRILKFGSPEAAAALGFGGPSARVIQRFAQVTLTNQTRTFWGYGATANLHMPTSAVAMTIVSSSANDTAAGSGARTVLVEGLGADYVYQTQVVTMNGTTPVTLAANYLRILQVKVVTTGSGLLNAGNLTVATVSGGNVTGYVLANQGQMGSLDYTVPAGRCAFVLSASFEPAFADLVYTDSSTAISQEAAQMQIYRRLVNGGYLQEARLATRRVPAKRDFGYGFLLMSGEDLDVSLQTTGTSRTFTGSVVILELPAV